MLLFPEIMYIIFQALLFKIDNSRNNAVRALKFLSRQFAYPGYFKRLFSSVCLNNDTPVNVSVLFCVLCVEFVSCLFANTMLSTYQCMYTSIIPCELHYVNN